MKITGRLTETFSGRSVHGRRGTLTFAEHLSVDAAGHTVITGHVTRSSRGLGGTRATITWTGVIATNGRGGGKYHGRWHEPPRKRT